jgi:hypothetical protein
MESATLKRSINLLQFVSIENEQFLVSMANSREEFAILSHIHGLFDAAISDRAASENDMVVFQLLTFTHYHFLFGTASLMRCHLSEAFASARCAIDGALIAAQIIYDRASQIAYVKREKPFDNFARYLGNLIKDGKPLPHRLVAELFKLHKTLSRISSHADVDSFLHRVNFESKGANKILSVQYFQFAPNEAERKIHALSLFHAFVMVLDVFSDFLVTEQSAVPKEWHDELRNLGNKIEQRLAQLRESLPKET